MKPQGWGKETGSYLEPPSLVQCYASSQLPCTEESLECKERAKLRDRTQDREGSADGIQKQLK